jgi:hypothetical protein
MDQHRVRWHRLDQGLGPLADQRVQDAVQPGQLLAVAKDDAAEGGTVQPAVREEYLRAEGGLTEEHLAETQAAADLVAKEMRAACLGMETRAPMAVFDGVYAEPHTGLDRQRGEYAAYLASFEGAA